MSLQTFEVSGFKSIRGAKIDLRPLNVLIGGNGAGKTNLIRAFELLRAVVGQRLGEHVLARGGADVLLHRGAKVTDTLKLAATFETNRTHNAYEVELMPVPGDRLAVREELGAFQTPSYPRPYKYRLGPGTESSLKEHAKTGANARHILQTVSRWQVFHFHDTSPLAKVKQYAAVEDNDALRPDAANLAPFLYRLQRTEPAAYQRIVATVRRIAPFFKDFQLRASPLRPDSMLLEWTEVGSDGYFNAHALSDGTLRFICLATLLLQPDPPSVILIDEPELGLHPQATVLLAGLMRSVSATRQLIVSTQSVTLVNQLQPEDLLIVDRVDGASTFRRPTDEDAASWLDEYALGELWEKDVLGGTPGR